MCYIISVNGNLKVYILYIILSQLCCVQERSSRLETRTSNKQINICVNYFTFCYDKSFKISWKLSTVQMKCHWSQFCSLENINLLFTRGRYFYVNQESDKISSAGFNYNFVDTHSTHNSIRQEPSCLFGLLPVARSDLS